MPDNYSVHTSSTDNPCQVTNVCTVEHDIVGKSFSATSMLSAGVHVPEKPRHPTITNSDASSKSTDIGIIPESSSGSIRLPITTSSTISQSVSTTAHKTSGDKTFKLKASPSSTSCTSKPASKITQLILSSKDIDAIISNSCKIVKINVMDCTSAQGIAQVKRRERHRIRSRQIQLKRLSQVNQELEIR